MAYIDTRYDYGFVPSALDAYNTVDELIHAHRPNEPVYCFYPHVLQDTVEAFRQGFPGRALYAVKANPDPHVISALYEAGVRHFDTASLVEVDLISNLCPEATCYFMAPARLRDTARIAYYKYGVRNFVVDHQDGLDLLLDEINAINCTIFVRMGAKNSDAMLNLSEKYGATPEETIDLLKAVKRSDAEPALAFNVGSLVMKTYAYQNALKACRAVLEALPFKIKKLDVGGGFPVSYAGLSVPHLQTYFDVFKNVREALVQEEDLELFCEPGRSMVARSMSTLTEVVMQKEGRLYLNDGLYGSFSELVCADQIAFPVRVYRDGLPRKLPIDVYKEYELFGPTCCSMDKFPTNVSLPDDMRRGDYIEFGLMGAYGLSGRTQFNGFYPDHMIEITDKRARPPEAGGH